MDVYKIYLDMRAAQDGIAAIKQSAETNNPLGKRSLLPGGQEFISDSEKYEYILDPLFAAGITLIASVRGVLEERRS